MSLLTVENVAIVLLLSSIPGALACLVMRIGTR